MSNFVNFNLESAVLKCFEIITHIFHLFVLKVRFNLEHDPIIPCSNNYLRHLIKLKEKTNKKFQNLNSHPDYFLFFNLRKECINY